MNCPEITPGRSLGKGKYLKLDELCFTDEKNRARKWEAVSRIGTPGAVMIIARTSRSGRIVLVSQFRPPAGKVMLEFPAGLIDPGESVEDCAIREMKEETGYTISKLEILPPVYSSPGMTGEFIIPVLAMIDEDDPANCNPESSPEESECSLLSETVPLSELKKRIDEHIAAGGGADSKLLIYSLFC